MSIRSRYPEQRIAPNLPQCGHRVDRREAMRIGGLSVLGSAWAGYGLGALGVGTLGLGDWFRLQRLQAAGLEQGEATSNRVATAKSCILIWLDGGPSHLETFDPKPLAPSEVRGPLETIATSIAGVRLGECLPNTARIIERIAIIRSMTSPLGEHNFGTHYMMTGYKPTPVLEYPTYGSVLAHFHPGTGVLPAHMSVPDFGVGGSRLSGNGFLPSAVAPFSVGGDPARSDFKVRDLDLYQGISLQRLDQRREFVSALDRFAPGASSADPSVDSDLERAFNLIASPTAKRAFDLSEESPALRQRYGSKTIGQSCLLARRLVEAGVPFVTVNNRGWDTHNDLVTRLKEGYTGAKIGVGLIPSLDMALATLIQDLQDRRMLDQTLVVVMGEFGRTPKLNTQGGRDHWPRVFSVLLAGGGVPGGQVIGSSDSVGESPHDRPVTPGDLAATIYALLGIDPQLELRTRDGRPVRLTSHESQAIREIVG